MPAHTPRARFLTQRIAGLRVQVSTFGVDRLRPELARLEAELAELEIPMVESVVGFDGGMSEPFLHRSRFTRGLLDVGSAIGIPGTSIARDLLAANGGRPDAGFVGPVQIPQQTFGASGPCPPSTVRGPLGTCIDVGAILPGGDPFITRPGEAIVEIGGQAVIGSFGMPAMVPDIVGAVRDHHGQVNPIRRCRAGVLGKDNLCYLKIPNSFRKWPKATRPPVSASDAKCIRRAASATKRVERLAKSVGLRTKKR